MRKCWRKSQPRSNNQDIPHLDELPLARPERLVGLRVGGQDLRAGELLGDALRERRKLLELEPAVHELLVLK